MTSTQTRIRRDTLTNLNLATPADGELAYNTTDDRLHVGNGTLAGAIPHLHCYDDIKSYFHYNTTAGSANAYTLTLPYAPASYVAGMRIRFKASFSCTGTSTINVNSLGAKTFKKVSSGTLAALSSGDIVSGLIYEAVYDGTDFQLFGFEMAGTLPGLVLLGSQSASASSSLDFTSLISSTYDRYTLIGKDLRPATDNVRLIFRTSTNNGASYDSSASNYAYYSSAIQLSSTTTADVSSQGDTSITINSASSGPSYIGNAAADGISFILTLINPLGTSRNKHIEWSGSFHGITTQLIGFRGMGSRLSTADIDAVRFLMSSGNITSGEIDMYGWRA